MIISHILAQSKNRVIGVNNTLPWHIPEDLKYFRDKTKGHILIMGRKTFESFPKPLPNRLHIVISRNPSQLPTHDPLVIGVPSLEGAIDTARRESQKGIWPEEVFIIGGGEIYLQSLPLADRIYRTVIDLEISGDTIYPEIPEDQFHLMSKTMGTNQPGSAPFHFEIWQKTSDLKARSDNTF